jgi:stage III sporulation protein SpoIIIAA
MEVGGSRIESFFPNQPRSLITAFKFSLNMNLEELRMYLSKRMKCEWISRDSEHFGDYIGIKKKDTQTIIRIFQNDDKYLVDILNRIPEEQNKWNLEIEEFKGFLREKGVEKFVDSDNNY